MSMNRFLKMRLWYKSARRWFHHAIVRSVEHNEDQIPVIGVIGVFGFLAYYYVWTEVFPQQYDNLIMRLFGAILCMGLALKHYWPDSIKPYFPFWWYFSALYTLPFFSTFLLLKNDYATVPLLVAMMSLFLLILLVDWLSINIIYVVGVALAWACYYLTTTAPHPPSEYLPYLLIYTFTILAGSVLSYKSSLLQQKKLEGMVAISSSMAHELRTPLLGIKSGAAGLKRYFPILFEGYTKAREAGLDVPKIREAHYVSLFPVVDRIDKETIYANTIIDMILTNVGRVSDDIKQDDLCSIVETASHALERYPFASGFEMKKIQWDPSPNFNYIGSQLLVVHVLFNLLKNALYHIAQAGKGDIYIWHEQNSDYNELHFKDTGPGIGSNALPRLFDRFYTTTTSGTGIGLSFCKMVMESIGGNITCQSVKGVYTEFILLFPLTSNH